MNRRVVVTGMGALTPIGNSPMEFWQSLKEGKSGIAEITRFDTTDFQIKVAGEVKNFEPENWINKKEIKRMDLFCQFAMSAAAQAVQDSNLPLDKIDKGRFGVIFGSGIGGLTTIQDQVVRMQDKGASRVAPLFIPMAISNMAAGNIAIQFGAQGPSACVVTACASGVNSIGEAFRQIKHGYADYFIAGGAEATVCKIGIAGFTSLTALSENNDITRASIPFDKERNGFVMGEGAGALILETLESAQERGAKIYAEIVGYGTTCDAYHMTSPSPDGYGAAKAMKAAIDEAGIGLEEVTYINAHGTSTVPNDKSETASIKSVFGDYAYKIPISSNKSMIGHLLGAAGAVEAIATIYSLRDDFAPPTIGLKVPDPECDLDYIPNQGRKVEMKYALSNSFGFGGHNGVICIKKW